MTRHLADHPGTGQGGQLTRYLAIARQTADTRWPSLFRRPTPPAGNRRLIEFLRIARGRTV